MASLTILLWVCGWIAGVAMRALHRHSVTVVDLVVVAFLSWIGVVLEMCHASASYEVWKNDKPTPRARHLMGGNPYQDYSGRKRR